jgi:hypothetical protein
MRDRWRAAVLFQYEVAGAVSVGRRMAAAQVYGPH